MWNSPRTNYQTSSMQLRSRANLEFRSCLKYKNIWEIIRFAAFPWKQRMDSKEELTPLIQVPQSWFQLEKQPWAEYSMSWVTRLTRKVKLNPKTITRSIVLLPRSQINQPGLRSSKQALKSSTLSLLLPKVGRQAFLVAPVWGKQWSSWSLSAPLQPFTRGTRSFQVLVNVHVKGHNFIVKCSNLEL